MDEEKIKELIIKMEVAALEEWNKGNPSEYLKIYSPDITYFDPFQEARIDGLDKMTTFYESLRGASCVNRYEIINPIVEVTERMAVLSYNLYSYSGENVYKWNCTEVYILNESNEWKVIHNHWSFIKPLDK
ncbi:MAG: nuclear transport factor 2 family protein [Dysgonomonas sp.]|nr:nuclear transport factor 2 family protein [Dysgonomonas sp.]